MHCKSSLIAFSILATAFSGCGKHIEFEHPLCEIGDDVDDPALFGSWKRVLDLDPELGPTQISDGDTVTILPAGELIQVRFSTKVDAGQTIQCEFDGRLTEINGCYYFELKRFRNNPYAFFFGREQDFEYTNFQLMCKAKRRGDELWVAAPGELDQQITTAVETKELHGRMQGKQTIVTATADELLAFLDERQSYPAWNVSMWKRVDLDEADEINRPRD